MYKNKKLIIFDLDGVLAPSKSYMRQNMSQLLCQLLNKKKVVVISGGAREQFQVQFLKILHCPPRLLYNLFLFEASGTLFYRYEKGRWKQIYSKILTTKERKKIKKALSVALKEFSFLFPQKTYGPQIEDRKSQITFSALGQRAPLRAKKIWDPSHKKRKRIILRLKKDLPKFNIGIGGTTSIDVTRKGIDKAYGILQMQKYLHEQKSSMLFVSDELYPGGNNYPVKKVGVQSILVKNPNETEKVIRKILCDA